MKAILEFELPDDKENFDAAAKGMEWALLVWDLDQQLRNWIKDEELTDDPIHVLESVRELLNELLIDNGLKGDFISILYGGSVSPENAATLSGYELMSLNNKYGEYLGEVANDFIKKHR